MTAPSQFQPPVVEYGGDEVSALVLDPGYSTVRAGFAGEDVPKSVCPSGYGWYKDNPHSLFGENNIHTPLPNVEIRNPMAEDGTVEDWDTAAKLWEYTVTSRLTGRTSMKRDTGTSSNGAGDAMDVDIKTEEMEKPMADNPLLMTEPGWSSTKAREKAIEIAMEGWDVPAFYLARTGVMAAFSAGKPTGLVIDIGASMCSVTPVSEGAMLKKAIQKSPLAGNFVSSQIRLMFSSSQPPVPLVPHYMVLSKTPVDAGQPSVATYKKFETPPTESFRHNEEERVLTEFKESVVQVWEGPGRLSSGSPTNEEVVKQHPGRPFEMPDGWNQMFGAERYKPAEGLFDAKAAYTDAENPAPRPEDTIPALVRKALDAVDVDLRPNLLSNIVVVGGSSLLVGLTRRIESELQALYPGPRVRIFAPGSTVERKYAGWIGGSVLASLGSFHQMWISRKEFEEHGVGIVEKRCK